MELENDEGYRELSLKQAQLTTAWEDIRERKEKGEVIGTTILNINKGGLIVEVNGIQGFLPLSQLAPEHYPKVADGNKDKILEELKKLVGQKLEVYLINADPKEGMLIFSEKALGSKGRKEVLSRYNLGDIVSGMFAIGPRRIHSPTSGCCFRKS